MRVRHKSTEFHRKQPSFLMGDISVQRLSTSVVTGHHISTKLYSQSLWLVQGLKWHMVILLQIKYKIPRASCFTPFFNHSKKFLTMNYSFINDHHTFCQLGSNLKPPPFMKKTANTCFLEWNFKNNNFS